MLLAPLHLLAALFLAAGPPAPPSFTYLGAFGRPGTTANGEFDGTVHMAVDAFGDVWVSNYANGYSRIQEFSPSGAHLHTWSKSGDIKTQLDIPGPLTLSTDAGFLYCIHYQKDYGSNFIWMGSRAGVHRTTFGGPYDSSNHNGRFKTATGIAVDSSGYVYVTDLANGNITKFTNNGAFVAEWHYPSSHNPALPREFTSITAVLTPSRSSSFLYVTDAADGCVLKLDTDGRILQSFGSKGDGRGQLELPESVAVDKNGFVYVADERNQCVQIYRPDGGFVPSFTGIADTKASTYHVTGVGFSRKGDILYILIPQIGSIQRYSLY